MPRRTPPPPGAAWLKLTGRAGKRRWALVDAVDYEAIVAAGPWHVYTPSKSGGKRKRRTRYARTMIGRRSVYLHRWLWEYWSLRESLPPAEHVDHKGGDGLDCRRSKLRAASHDQNQRARGYTNSLGLKGIRRNGNWFIARITLDGRRRVLGKFPTAETAAAAYDRAARELHGEFAQTNFAEVAA